MRTLSKIAAGAAFAAALAGSSSAFASTIINFAQYQQKASTDTIRWTQSASKTGGRLEDIGDPTVIFRIWDTEVAPGNVVDVEATMQLDASVDSGNPATSFAGQEFQQGLHGSFSFTSLKAFSRNGVSYGVGTNLLSAIFSGGSIFGAGTGSVNGDALAGATVDYTSAVLDTSVFDSQTFTLSLNAIHRGKASGLTHSKNESLKSFTATTTGQFAAAVTPVPEPSTWAMMLIGLFGAGSTLRVRRRMSLAAA